MMRWRLRSWTTVSLLLAVVGVATAGCGLVRGPRRPLQASRGPDALFTIFVALPFAYYASEVLAEWTRPRGLRSVAVWIWLGDLALLSALTFSTHTVFWKSELPGVDYITLETPWHE